MNTEIKETKEFAKQWIEEGKQQSVEEIIETTNRLVLGGVKGFFR